MELLSVLMTPPEVAHLNNKNNIVVITHLMDHLVILLMWSNVFILLIANKISILMAKLNMSGAPIIDVQITNITVKNKEDA